MSENPAGEDMGGRDQMDSCGRIHPCRPNMQLTAAMNQNNLISHRFNPTLRIPWANGLMVPRANGKVRSVPSLDLIRVGRCAPTHLPTPQLADFGLSTVLDEETNRMTKTVVGTPNYMSPCVLQVRLAVQRWRLAFGYVALVVAGEVAGRISKAFKAVP